MLFANLSCLFVSTLAWLGFKLEDRVQIHYAIMRVSCIHRKFPQTTPKRLYVIFHYEK